MTKVTEIRGTMTLSNGEIVEFVVGPDGDQRWGNTRENVADTVDACQAISDAMLDNDLWD